MSLYETLLLVRTMASAIFAGNMQTDLHRSDSCISKYNPHGPSKSRERRRQFMDYKLVIFRKITPCFNDSFLGSNATYLIFLIATSKLFNLFEHLKFLIASLFHNSANLNRKNTTMTNY
jgi:hypothetical protein